MQINPKKLNPLGFHLMKLLQDPTIRLIILFGGSSSGKSYSVAQMILIMTLWDYENTIVWRKVGASIIKTIYEDFKVAAKQLGISRLFRFKERQIVCLCNGAKIDFSGMDDSEKIKGISNYKRVVLDEWSEFTAEDYKQVRKRLRGKKGQQIITTFNPIKETHWIKKDVFDIEQWHEISSEVEIAGKKIPPELTRVKSIRMNSAKMILNPRSGEIEEHAPDTVAIQSTYLNNFWVVGSPDGTYGFYDEQCIADFEKDRMNDPDYYNVYALGEWGIIRSGSEFFGSFNRGRHTCRIAYDPTLPVHISVDSNVLPYISCTYWQVAIDGGNYKIRQIDETCAESPDNTVRKAAKIVAGKLLGFGADKVIMHGDASTRAANNIDDEKRSFHDLFIDTLQKSGIEVEDKVGSKNPGVAMSGEFINAIFDDTLPCLNITIDENCRNSIEDYLSVQKDANGSILKTRVRNKTTMQSYEQYGHLSDTFRYVVIDLLHEHFLMFANRRKRNLYARNGVIHFFNPATDCKYSREILYAIPNINGKLAMVHGKLCGDKWHIVKLLIKETSSTDEMRETLIEAGSSQTIIECSSAYYRFIRSLRKDMQNVRAVGEASDIHRRIAATSDFVKNCLLFDERRSEENMEYSQFISNLLDYSRNSGENLEASAVLSGFVQFVAKFSFDNNDNATNNKAAN